jgi:acetyltransferase-like isoleucine patch superfamily enzyme
MNPTRRLAILVRLAIIWNAACLRYGGFGLFGRCMTRLASLVPLPHAEFIESHAIAHLVRRGYVAPTARCDHRTFIAGEGLFVGHHARITQSRHGGRILLGQNVCLEHDVHLSTGDGASITIGDNTYIGGRSSLSATVADIRIGSDVLIAGNCGFFPYNHGTAGDRLIREQNLVSKGPIVIGDDVWVGRCVTVLDGVTIGHGAVIGAGSVVAHDVPPYAVAAGQPARVVRMREADTDRANVGAGTLYHADGPRKRYGRPLADHIRMMDA